MNGPILWEAVWTDHRSSRNGTLQDYLGQTVSKDDFKRRLVAAVEGQTVPTPVQQVQSTATTSNDHAPSPSPVAATTNTTDTTSPQVSQPSSAPRRPVQQRPPESSRTKEPSAAKKPVKKTEPKEKPASKTTQETKASQPPQKPTSSTAVRATSLTDEAPKPKPPAPTGPPSQYRLQVRLFDGRSIRSSFSPTQTIRGDVRPWLDQQMVDDRRPYNLKHILTPLPSRTLSVTEESQALQDLGLGSTANLVMVPVQSYTEAYSAAGSLPVRAISGVYNAVYSIAGTATGLVGSFFGYGTAAPANESGSPPAPPTDNARRPRPSGPNIRTLRDQQEGRGDSQLYNGNQVGSFD